MRYLLANLLITCLCNKNSIAVPNIFKDQESSAAMVPFSTISKSRQGVGMYFCAINTAKV